MRRVLLAHSVEGWAALIVLRNPLAGETAVLNARQHFLHVLLDLRVNHDRPTRVVAELCGVADRVAHITHATLIQQVNDEFQFVHALEVRRFRLVSRLDQCFVCSLDQRRYAAAQDRLLAEQVGLGLFLEGCVENAGACAANAPRVCEADGMRVSGSVLMHCEQTRHARTLSENLAHAMSGSLGRDHRHIHALRRLDSVVVDVEAMSEHQRLAGEHVLLDRLPIHLGLQVIGNQHHDDVRLLGDFGDHADLQSFCLRLRDAAAALVQPDHHIKPVVVQIECVGVSLAAIADYAEGLAIHQRHIGVRFVVHLCHLVFPFRLISFRNSPTHFRIR